MSRVVVLKGNPHVKEGAASEAITPGHLIEFGGSNDLQKHSTAAGNARKAFADLADMVGKGIDDAYATGDQVKYVVAASGDEINALVAAGASAISKGDPLESAGDGTVRVQATEAATADTQRDSVVGYALEAVDNSGGGSAVRIEMEVA